MKRYHIRERTPARGEASPPFAIWDEWIGAFCALPDGPVSPGHAPNLLPLEFPHREAAESWMLRCYATWAEWDHGRGKQWVPEHWKGFTPPESSPWSGASLPLHY